MTPLNLLLGSKAICISRTSLALVLDGTSKRRASLERMLGLKGEAQGDRMLPNNALKLTSPPGSCKIGRKGGLAA
jgi:hypothetical protein